MNMTGWKKSINTLKQMFAMEGYWRYLVPFAVYLFAGSIVSLFLPGLEELHIYISYTLRTVVVGLLLWKVRHRFTELADKKLLIDPTALVLTENRPQNTRKEGPKPHSGGTSADFPNCGYRWRLASSRLCQGRQRQDSLRG